jgi:hypothetical protein
MGVEAAAAVEADISALLAGKSYEQLVSLQRQIQDKLTSGEPVDVDYWEGLLKKLLVWKSKVFIPTTWLGFGAYLSFRLNSKVYMKLLFAIVWSNFASDKGTKPSRLKRSCWRVLPDLLPGGQNPRSRWMLLNKKRLFLLKRWRNIIGT